MITQPTVFILGAGASHAYGFPLGWQLVQKIVREVTLNSRMFNALNEAGISGNDILKLQSALSSARRLSIDAFLQARPDLLVAGKAAISAFLMECEQDVLLDPFRLDRKPHEERDWYTYLFAHMLGRSPNAFARNQLKVITFNFDRSFERAMFRAVVSSFAMAEDKAGTLCRSVVPVLHMHGLLGLPTWLFESVGYPPRTRPYQHEWSGNDLAIAMSSIKVVHEEIPPEHLQTAREWISEAATVCFLGFSYDVDNLRKLPPADVFKDGQKSVRGLRYHLPEGPAGRAVLTLPMIRFEGREWDILTFLMETDIIHG